MAKQEEEEDGHSEGMLVEPNFCTLRKADDCGCGNDYTACVKDEGSWAADAKYPQLLKIKKRKVTQFWSANAHHILCVAEVTKVISKDNSLQRITSKTEWCINDAHNMIAMPLFAHTVLWYMFQGGDKDNPPAFKNIPNHDHDHGPYNEEVETELNKIKANIKKAGHKYKASSLAPTLKRKSTMFRNRLKDRGKRGSRPGGTHNCWVRAMKGNDEGWYEPYSMAADGEISSKVFPGSFEESVEKVFDRLWKALLNIK